MINKFDIEIASTCFGKIRHVIVSEEYTVPESEDLFQFDSSSFSDFFNKISILANRRIMVCPAVSIIYGSKTSSDPNLFVGSKSNGNYSSHLELIESSVQSSWLSFLNSATFAKAEILKQFVLFDELAIKLVDLDNDPRTDSVFKWPQDFYLRFESVSSNVDQEILYPFVGEGFRRIENYNDLKKNKCLDRLNIEAKQFDVEVGSGNIHVYEDFLFIGESLFRYGYELNEHISAKHKELCHNRIEQLGLDVSDKLTQKDVNNQLNREFGSSKQLIHVGANEALDHINLLVDREANSYAGSSVPFVFQPFYHIDLFFHPGKASKLNGRTVFSYFLADAKDCWQTTSDLEDQRKLERIRAIQVRLEKTERYLNDQLKCYFDEIEVIKIPMNVYNIGVTAFVNGLVHGETFLMPDYSFLRYDSADEYKKKYLESIKTAKLQFEKVYDNVELVTSRNYGYEWALKCQTFVSQREFSTVTE